MSDSPITEETLAAAEKLAGVEYTPEQRTLLLGSGLDLQLEHIRALRQMMLPNELGPAEVFDPRPPGWKAASGGRHADFTRKDPGPVPQAEPDIAFAPLTALGYWLRSGQISSRRLTEIYIERLRRLGGKFECVVTITDELAFEQAEKADAEYSAGRYRGPLHGVPWVAKDLLDTAGIRTTWGATPYRDRVAGRDAAVVECLRDAGAVLIAKATLGALAYGDIWFGGRTRNPWNPAEGSAGSSAGSAASVASGLAGFAIGTETLGSIVSPSMRCGTTGLRPTFGRVSRHGAMALCWSLDKIGPICRRVEDVALVLDILNGYDPRDPGSIDIPFSFDASSSVKGLRIGYDPRWFQEDGVEPLDRRALESARALGVELVEITLPALPYDALWPILYVEAAAAFEELSLTGKDALLVRQDAYAWPNLFRKARLVSAVALVQAQRLRRVVIQEMDAIFAGVDALIGPTFSAKLQLITNMTGHPALALRAGFVDKPTRAVVTPIGTVAKPAEEGDVEQFRVPHGITLWGRLFDEGTLCNIGMALEARFGVWDRRPPGCD